MEPHQRAPAPGDLGLIQAFVNTRDIEAGHEELASPDHLRIWLSHHNLVDSDSHPTERDHVRCLEVREALRALLLANNGGSPTEGALAALNRIAAESRLRLRFEGESEARLDPDSEGIDASIGRLLSIVFVTMTQGTWWRLKACKEDGCHWAFYDHSKNRSGAWCSMAVCGNRTKTRSYRERRQTASADGASRRGHRSTHEAQTG